MSTKTLGPLYATLSPEERTALAYAAAARGDEVELDRIHSSAPREGWSIPHHSRVFRAVSTLAVMHRAEQLEFLAAYWFAMARMNGKCEDDSDSATQPWGTAALSCAYRFRANVEAFRLFCEELGICVDDIMCDIPGAWLNEMAEANLPDIVRKPEELAILITRDFEIPANVVTVNDILTSLRRTYRAFAMSNP